MPSHTEGAQGSLQLRYRCHESASGFNDETMTTVSLEAGDDGASIVLVESVRISRTMGGETSSTKRIAIGVEELIQHITRHGTKL